MAIDTELLASARAAEARLVEAERALDLARAEFRYGVRKLHLAGGSLREIGEALNLSHQRVHQIVEEARGGRGGVGRAGLPSLPGRREPTRCSFCGRSQQGQKEAGKFVAGPGFISICDTCVPKASEVIATGQVGATPISSLKPIPAEVADAKCSFCGKPRDRVDGLAFAAGLTTAGVAICTECLVLCQEIMAESRPA